MTRLLFAYLKASANVPHYPHLDTSNMLWPMFPTCSEYLICFICLGWWSPMSDILPGGLAHPLLSIVFQCIPCFLIYHSCFGMHTSAFWRHRFMWLSFTTTERTSGKPRWSPGSQCWWRLYLKPPREGALEDDKPCRWNMINLWRHVQVRVSIAISIAASLLPHQWVHSKVAPGGGFSC